MTQDSKCFFGLHKYEIIDRYEIKNPYGIVIGTSIISRCINCGKVKDKTVYTDNQYLR